MLLIVDLFRILSLTSTNDSSSELLPKFTRITILSLLFRIITNHKVNTDTVLVLSSVAPVNSIVWKAGSCLAIETFSHLIAPLLKEFANPVMKDNEDRKVLQALCSHWIRFITLACHEDQPVDLRYSAAQGIAHSLLFSTYAVTDFADQTWFTWILHFFLLCLDLLQDDDDDVREVANDLICQLIASSPESSNQVQLLGLTTTVRCSHMLFDRLILD